MPFALLLQHTFHRIYRGTRRLEHWNQLVTIEVALADRARSAFLVRWFGKSVPIEALGLRVAIANLDELKGRYEEEMRLAAPGPAGLNLTEPLAGMAGTMAGALLSPTGVIMVSVAWARSYPVWLAVLWDALATIVFLGLAPIVVAVGGVGGLLAGGAAAIGAGLVDEPDIHAVYDIMGSIAGLLVAVRAFVEQLLGPREGVRNPLIRRVLELGDMLARAVPFLLALFAVLVTRVGIMLGPLATQVRAMRALIAAVIDTLKEIVSDFQDRLQSLFANELLFFVLPVGGGLFLFMALVYQGALVLIMNHLMLAVQGSMDRIFRSLDRLVDAFFPPEDPAKKAKPKTPDDPWTAQFGRLLGQTFDPFNEMIDRLTAEMKLMARLLSPPSSAKPGPPGLLSRAWAIASALSGPSPKFPALPSLPDPKVIAAKAGGAPALGLNAKDIMDVAAGIDFDKIGPPFTLSKAAAAALERERHPASVFAGERKDLRDAAGRTLEEQLRATREQDMALRNTLFSVLEQALPPAAAPYVAQLHDVLAGLDAKLYSMAPAEKAKEGALAEPPVLALPESDRLQPVVHRLVIRAAGVDRPVAADWTDALTKLLRAQTYVVPAGA